MWWYFSIGLGFGALIAYLGYWLFVRREIFQLDEDRVQLQSENEIVLEFMHRLVEAMQKGFSEEELFREIAYTCVSSIRATSAAVFREDESGDLVSVACEGLFPPQVYVKTPEEQGISRSEFIAQVLQPQRIGMGDGVIGSVGQSGKAIFIEDVNEDSRIPNQGDPLLQIRSLIAVPIVFGRKVLGIIAVVNPREGKSFSKTDFLLIKSLAEQAGLTLQNAEFFKLQLEKKQLDLDLNLASSVQSMLLPKEMPVIEGLDMDVVYLPARKVGGDLYDVFRINEDEIGVAIADVSGKGIAASLLMAICQTHLRHYAKVYSKPSEVLSAMNKEIYGSVRREMFVTMVYAVINIKASKVVLARSGHELPVHLKGGQEVKKVNSEGMAIGMVPSEVFETVIEDCTFDFKVDDWLVLYTDGVVEMTNSEGIEYSLDKMCGVLKQKSDLSAAQLNKEIIRGVENFAGTRELQDDLTLVTLKRG